MLRKQIHIYGGGTFSHVRTHLALAMPAFGETAKKLKVLCEERFDNMDVNLHLTKMADSHSNLVTNEDVETHVLALKEDFNTKVVFFNVGMCDFDGEIYSHYGLEPKKSGKYATRLKSDQNHGMNLVPKKKVIKEIRDNRKDIFLVAFKTTSGATEQEQYLAGLNLMKKNSCNLVLANDVVTRVNMIITPEEDKYHVTTDRNEALKQLVDMTY